MAVAVIGLGVVGQAQARLFKGHDLVTYDPKDGQPYPAAAIAGCDFAVIAVGTPAAPDGSADLAQVYSAIAKLPRGMPVLIRSTVPPGTTEGIAGTWPGPVACSPEFIYEGGTGPWRESFDVPWMLLGGDFGARAFFGARLRRVFAGPIHGCGATVAELAKYTANLYWAARVTFVNELAGIAAAHGVDWEEVREAWLCDQRVNAAHTAMAGFPPGFGGRCWPKDLTALIAAAEDTGYKAMFLDAVRQANRRFTDG